MRNSISLYNRIKNNSNVSYEQVMDKVIHILLIKLFITGNINREREMFASPEGQELMCQWGLPAGLVGIGALSLGYPAAEAGQAKPRKEDYFRIIK